MFLALSPAFAVFVLCCFLLGGFAGLHYTVATTLLTRSFEGTGTVIGVHGLGAPLAGIVTPVAVSWVGTRYGWRPAILFIAAVGVPVWVLFYVLVRPPEPRKPGVSLRERFEPDLLRDLLSR